MDIDEKKLFYSPKFKFIPKEFVSRDGYKVSLSAAPVERPKIFVKATPSERHHH